VHVSSLNLFLSTFFYYESFFFIDEKTVIISELTFIFYSISLEVLYSTFIINFCWSNSCAKVFRLASI